MSATLVEVSTVTKRFGSLRAVDGLSLRLEPGSFTALLGASGCGKSTTLALIAGLLDPDAGEIRIDGEPMRGVPTERRPLAMMFQKPLLFPHLTVGQNVAFGLRMRRVPRHDARRRVREMLERVQLSGLAERRVGELSGGQEQRVALARALVVEPGLLLLDEPFSQLDAGLRAEMRSLLRSLHEQVPVTTLFVTHDQSEAVEVADTVALLVGGRAEGNASPEVYYRRPPSLVAARFFGPVNELSGAVRSGCFTDETGLVRVPTPVADGCAVLVVRPESVRVTAAGWPGALAARTLAARFAGTHLVMETELPGGQRMTAHVPVDTAVTIGARTGLVLQPDACTVLAAG